MSLSLSEQFLYVTSQIFTVRADGREASGTAFFYEVRPNGVGAPIPCLVTNRHVVEGAVGGEFMVSMAKDGAVVPGDHICFGVDAFNRRFLMHPGSDLAVMPLTVLSEGFQNAGRAPFWVSLTRDFIPDQDFIDSLSPIENLLMVGYPLGLRDEPSNSPIFRRGITATPYSRDFQRRPEFLTDLAALPGSSGSPVFIADFGGYLDKNFRFNVGQSRLRLLGVHSAGHRHQVRVQDPPRTDDDSAAAPSVWLPAHLGYCIKATELIWFERHLADFMAQTPPLAFRTTEEERAGEAG